MQQTCIIANNLILSQFPLSEETLQSKIGEIFHKKGKYMGDVIM